MGTVTASVFLTLDGVMEAPHLWHPRYVSKDSMAILAEQMDSATAMLLGRRTYNDFAGYWPNQGSDVPLADATNGIQKYVLSQTLTTAAWHNTTVVSGALASTVGALKEREARILVPGSARLVQGLLRERLLDELWVTLDPVVAGTGRRLFLEGSPTTRLELLDHRRLPHGVIHLVYQTLYTADAGGHGS